jgi:hypothetical protein
MGGEAKPVPGKRDALRHVAGFEVRWFGEGLFRPGPYPDVEPEATVVKIWVHAYFCRSWLRALIVISAFRRITEFFAAFRNRVTT